MPEYRPEDHLFDEKLAEFTDQVIKQKGGEALPPLAEEGEFHQLQETVIQLKQAGMADHPRAPFSARLFAALQKEWKRIGPKPGQANIPSVSNPGESLDKIKTTYRRIMDTWGRPVALGLAALMLAVLLLLPKDIPLSGTAGTNSEWLPVEWGIGVFCIGLLIWLLSKKQD